jgi:exopolysaccharide biosynthesis polyprenyl glycosylphosphotransferase
MSDANVFDYGSSVAPVFEPGAELDAAVPPAAEARSGWEPSAGRFARLDGHAWGLEAKSPDSLLRRDALYRRLLAAADVLSAALALVACIVAAGDDQLKLTTLLALPLVVLASKVIGLYDRDEFVLRKTTLEEAPALFQLSTLYALTIWLLGPVLVAGHLGPAQVFGLWMTLFVFSLSGRAFARAVARRMSDEERCVVIGDSQFADCLRAKLAASSFVKAKVVALLPLEEDYDGGADSGLLERMADVRACLTNLGAERVIIAPRTEDVDWTLHVIRMTKSLGVHVSVFPRITDVVGSAVELDEIHGLTMLGVRRFGLTRSSALMKRALDLSGSSIGLLLAAPLFALFALAIKRDSPGPVFFRQTRIGRDGKKFQMVKFRTMDDGADFKKSELLALNEADGLFKIADDPRITRVGRFLRRTSFDELPQLWNVLCGEMSLVGPRPLVADDDRRVEGWQRRRLQLTPGMTGRWQILGSSRIPLSEMVELDYLYILNWSLWSDIKILLRTVPHILARNGM